MHAMPNIVYNNYEFTLYNSAIHHVLLDFIPLDVVFDT